MKVSIITVVYNGAKTISGCIDSVLGQNYPHLEYLIIDGGSTDGTLEIVQKYGSKIAVVCSEPDRGIYDAMNKGIALATGELIGILNADDFYKDNDVVSKIVSELNKAQADAIYADLVYVDSEKTHIIKRYWRSGVFEAKSFLWGWMPPHPTFFLKSASYSKFGNYRLDLGSAADYELMFRMLHVNRIKTAYMPEITTIMRAGGVSNENVFNRLKANKNDQKAWQVNQIKPYFFTLWLKPIRKILQFVYRPAKTVK